MRQLWNRKRGADAFSAKGKQCAIFWRSSIKIENTGLPVDERISLLGLLEEMHKFALAVRQVRQVFVHGITVRAIGHCQALISVHNLETHLIVFVLISIVSWAVFPGLVDFCVLY